MKELYITNEETIYPHDTNSLTGVAVRLYGRTAEGTADSITVTGFESYFYIPADETDLLSPLDHDGLERYEETDVVPLEERYDENPTQLAKVVASSPGDIYDLKQMWETTWGADVGFTNRLRIDKDIRTGVRAPSSECNVDEVEAIDFADVQPRVLTLDIETDDRGSGFPAPGDARVLSIAAHDSYTQDYVTFIDTETKPLGEFFGFPDANGLVDLGLTEPTEVKGYRDERLMLLKFAQWVDEMDPDIITGWNCGDDSSDGFDLPHLVKRMEHCTVNTGRLSREGYVKCYEKADDWYVSIKGRTTYDMMDAWASTKFTEPDSRRLDDVAQSALDDAKIEHPDMGYYEMYEHDPVKFVEYNTKDTRLTVQITVAENVIGFKKRLKDMIGVRWEETRQNNEFVAMSVRRKCREHRLSMITAWDNPNVIEAAKGQQDEVKYKGAYVFPPFEGVKRNVLGVDLASLYPMTQAMLNASPDTKIDRAVAFKQDIEHVVAANGVAFRTDVDSIIRELVDEYDELKMEFKRKRNAATYGTDEWEELANAYNVTKTIYNSYYGYTGWDKSPLFDTDIAAAVTLTGQRVIKRTAEYIREETEGEVVYGDTDSNYLQLPSEWGQVRTLEYAHEMCDTLSNEVYPELCEEFLIDPAENRWEIEVEMRAERFFMSGQKKRYAYLKTWDEGDEFAEVVGTDKPADEVDWETDDYGKYSVTGYECVKSNFAALTKEMQDEVLETIIRGGSKQDVASIVHEAATSINGHDPDWEALGMPQGLGQKLDPAKHEQDGYYTFNSASPQGAHPRGAWWANQLLDVKYDEGDKPKRAYLKPTMTVEGEAMDVICYEKERDLDPIADDIQMDVSKMQEKVLLNPMKKILRSFDMVPSAALQGQSHEQTGLSGFC